MFEPFKLFITAIETNTPYISSRLDMVSIRTDIVLISLFQTENAFRLYKNEFYVSILTWHWDSQVCNTLFKVDVNIHNIALLLAKCVFIQIPFVCIQLAEWCGVSCKKEWPTVFDLQFCDLYICIVYFILLSQVQLVECRRLKSEIRSS